MTASGAKKPNDHKRIAWRLTGKIILWQLAAFIAVDAFLVFLIVVHNADEATLKALSFSDENLIEIFSRLRGIRYLDIGTLWALISIGIVQILLLVGQAVDVRKHVREQLEPLRELRVAADAFADAAYTTGAGIGGTGVSAEALRRMADALSHVEARDMNAHIAAESLSPELRPLLEAIKGMLDRLEAAYAAQAKFVSDASHELRTPIAVIQGYANLLSRWGSEDPEALSESIEAIRSEAESMKQMVNQLLFLARGDSYTLRVEMQDVDLVQILNEVLREALMIEEGRIGQEGYGDDENADGDAGYKRHEIVAQLPAGGVIASADPALIKQLVRILVDNSVKYTPQGYEVSLSVSADPEIGRAYIIVQDEGHGIPADVLPNIFDRFVRADEARTRNVGGTGLGLSIAKQIAERHGGSLEVVSALGLGTKFTVILPLKRQAGFGADG